MATDLPTEALRTLVAALSGLPTTHVRWDGEEEHAHQFSTSQAGQLTLDVVARAENGTPEFRYDLDEEDPQLETVGQQQVLTLSLRADNFLGLGAAFDLLNKIRLRLYRRTSRKALRDAGLALVDSPSIVSLDHQVDNRRISAASMDIRVSQIVTEVPPSADQAGQIDKVSYKAEEDISDFDEEPEVNLRFTPTT